MADLVYRSVMRDIKQKILGNEYPGMRLPDERSLSDIYQVFVLLLEIIRLSYF